MDQRSLDGGEALQPKEEDDWVRRSCIDAAIAGKLSAVLRGWLKDSEA
ncbi:MAG TPA: hypothetical protein VFR51_16365 [Pyrinomonadaceae bacterium]|nr:hypothetical protein [Pyrinomonadaceae bacterium]